MCSRKKPKRFIIQIPYSRNRAYVECKNKCDASNNRGNWNNLKIFQKISEQHNGKAQHRGIKKKTTGHCAHISEYQITE
jgi:hypothetical protein